MLKTIIIFFAIIAVFTTLSALVPNAITTDIDNAIVYFLQYIWSLNNIVDVAVVMTCLQVIVSFELGVAIFFMLHWALRIAR